MNDIKLQARIDKETDDYADGSYAKHSTARNMLECFAADVIAMERERWMALYPDLAQLLQGCKQDWIAQNAWSEWDQSVLDRLAKLAGSDGGVTKR